MWLWLLNRNIFKHSPLGFDYYLYWIYKTYNEQSFLSITSQHQHCTNQAVIYAMFRQAKRNGEGRQLFVDPTHTAFSNSGENGLVFQNSWVLLVLRWTFSLTTQSFPSFSMCFYSPCLTSAVHSSHSCGC